MKRRKLSPEHRSVAAAGAISSGVGVAAAVLIRHTGADPSAAVIAGGAAFGGTMTLALEVLKYLRGL